MLTLASALNSSSLCAFSLGENLHKTILSTCLTLQWRRFTKLICFQAMELIDDAGSPPNLLVHLDTYHMNIEESSSEFAVGVCADKLG